jgi:hypothetical protein
MSVTLPVATRFVVLADASPGLLPRLLQPFAKRDLTPDILRAERAGDGLRAEVSLHAMPAEVVHPVAGNLGQIVGVRAVQVLGGAGATSPAEVRRAA